MNSPSDARPESAFSTDAAALAAEAAGIPGAPADASGAPAPAAPGKTSAEVEREILAAPRKTPADDMRSAIYAKAQANRGNMDTSEAAMQTGVQAMLAESEGRPMESDAAPASAPLDRPESTITLNVEGRQVQVPMSQVLEAGVRGLQKESSADYRQQRLALAERSLAEQSARLEARSREIEASRTATPTGASAPTERADLPTGGTAGSAGMKEALDALLDSDVDGASKALQKIVADTASAAVLQAMGNHRSAAAPAPATVSEADRVWPADVRAAADSKLISYFPDIANDPTLAQTFVARLQAEMASPVNQTGRVDLVDLGVMIGRELTASRTATPTARPASSAPDELAARRTLAARVPGVPTSAVPRFVAPTDTGPAPPTRSQTVLAMKKARGQA